MRQRERERERNRESNEGKDARKRERERGREKTSQRSNVQSKKTHFIIISVEKSNSSLLLCVTNESFCFNATQIVRQQHLESMFLLTTSPTNVVAKTGAR